MSFLKDIVPILQLRDGANILILVAVAVLTCVQISPIKVNPWDAILGWIGDRLNSNIKKSVDAIGHKLDEHIEDSEKQKLEDMRDYILNFSNSCMNHKKHTQEEFERVIYKCDFYETYVEKNNIKNGVITSAIADIRRIYLKCIQENSFLREE